MSDDGSPLNRESLTPREALNHITEQLDDDHVTAQAKRVLSGIVAAGREAAAKVARLRALDEAILSLESNTVSEAELPGVAYAIRILRHLRDTERGDS